MTKQDTALYADIDKIDVPEGLRKLDKNHVDTIAASAKAKGRLYVPVLLKTGKGGRFILEDGQHRLAAAKQLGWTKIEYRAVEDEDAGDVANMVRKQYSFAERIKVVTQRKEDADHVLASALGVTDRKVKQLRQLSTLPKEVIDAVDNGFISEAVAQRATMLPKDMLKELVTQLKRGQLPYWADSVEDIKERIEDSRIPLRIALFDVEASGLKFERDLFDEDGGYFHDPKAFMQHQLKAVEEIARKLTDKVTVSVGKFPSDWYSHTSFHHRAGHAQVRAALTPDAAERVKKLDAEIARLEKKNGAYEERDEARGALSDIIGRPDNYDPEKVKNVSVLAFVTSLGEANFKIVSAAPAAKAGSATTGKAKGASAAAPKKPFEAHTRKAWAIARDQRDLLIQEAMLANQTFGLRVVLASLLTSGDFGVSLDHDVIRTQVEEHTKRAKEIGEPKLSESFPEVWKRVCGMETPALIAEIIRTVTPFNYHGNDYAHLNSEDKQRLEVLREAIICVEAPPLPHDYFAAHQTAQLLKILADVKGKKEADLYAGKPKKVVVAAVQAACLEAAWLPNILEAIPDVKKPKAKKAAAPKVRKPAKAKAKKAA